MKLFLDNPAFVPNYKIKHRHRLFFIGSCFADAMSAYFLQRKFDVMQNPFGILYNPVSIANSVEQIAEQQTYSEADFHFQNDVYGSWHHHSNLAQADAASLKKSLEDLNKNALSFLKKTDVVFITLGTAWVFYHKEKQTVVANNLRAPHTYFDKKILPIGEIEKALARTIDGLKKINKTIEIVLTVSPVRHTRQGLAENNRSKARLIEAVHTICEQTKECIYFPSYELVLDVLRDYRFAAQDLVHPNQQATDFVWEFLHEHFIHEQDKNLIHDLYKLHLASQHIVKNDNGLEAKKFKNEQLLKIDKLHAENNYLNLDKEKAHFENL